MSRSSEWAEKLITRKTDAGLVQFFRYGVVGGVAFCADFSLLFALTHFLRIHYLISAMVGFLVGVWVNYLLSVRWVFARRQIASRVGEFGLFALIGVVGLGLNELLMWLLTGVVGIHYLGSKIVTTAGVYLWNFFARKKLVF